MASDIPVAGGRAYVVAESTIGETTQTVQATLKITLPDGNTINTIPIVLTQEGTYTVEATRPGYAVATSTFTVTKNLALLTPPPTEIFIGDRLFMQFNKQVPAVELRCSNGTETLATDAQGQIIQTPSSSGACGVFVEGKQYAAFNVRPKNATDMEGFLTIMAWFIGGLAVFYILYSLIRKKKPTDPFAAEAVGLKP